MDIRRGNKEWWTYGRKLTFTRENHIYVHPKDYPHINAAFKSSKDNVRNRMRRRGGNVPFWVTAAKNFAKEGRQSRWTGGLEVVFAEVSRKTGDSSSDKRDWWSRGRKKHPFPLNPHLPLPLTLVALKNYKRHVRDIYQTEILSKVLKENRQILLSVRHRQCFPKHEAGEKELVIQKPHQHEH